MSPPTVPLDISIQNQGPGFCPLSLAVPSTALPGVGARPVCPTRAARVPEGPAGRTSSGGEQGPSPWLLRDARSPGSEGGTFWKEPLHQEKLLLERGI